MAFLCYTAGEYHCPVLNKVFTEFTHIVAVKTTGNVFCYEVCFSRILSVNTANLFCRWYFYICKFVENRLLKS